MIFRLAACRVMLASDAMAAAGAPDGSYLLGDLRVEASDGRAVLAGTSTLAGSLLTLDNAMRLGTRNTIDPNTVVEALTLTPSRLLNTFSTLSGCCARDTKPTMWCSTPTGTSVPHLLRAAAYLLADLPGSLGASTASVTRSAQPKLP